MISVEPVFERHLKYTVESKGLCFSRFEEKQFIMVQNFVISYRSKQVYKHAYKKDSHDNDQ